MKKRNWARVCLAAIGIITIVSTIAAGRRNVWTGATTFALGTVALAIYAAAAGTERDDED